MGILWSSLYENNHSTFLEKSVYTDKMQDHLHFTFPEESLQEQANGLFLNEIPFPEEILILIFSYLPASHILNVRLVCKKWYNLTKLHTLWSTIYFRKFRKLPQRLPWYLFYALFGTKYFTNNLLKNNCGQRKFEKWLMMNSGSHKFRIEETPVGSDPLPTGCSDFQNYKSCFVTSYEICSKAQQILLRGNLINFIVNKFKPSIHVSEWVAGRFDCGGHYVLEVKLHSPQLVFHDTFRDSDLDSDSSSNSLEEENVQLPKPAILLREKREFNYNANEATQWRKIDLVLENYPEGVDGIIFQHSGIDNQYWRGHYGPKMSGGVVKILFDSIKPEESNTNDIF